MTQGIRIAIDRGGTFTDSWARVPGRERDILVKVLSESDEYDDAPTECIRKILEIVSDNPIPRGTLLDLEDVESIRMGTTVATNALLERKGERVALLITKGFHDMLHIGNQARPDIFDLTIRRLEKLYEKVVEVDERVTIEGFAEDPEPKPIDIQSDPALREGLTGEAVRILREPDYAAIERDLLQLWEQGFRNISVALMHSYTFPDHEIGIEQIAKKMGFRTAVSSQLQPVAKLVPRAQSAVTDAYLSPITQRYLDHFQKGFKGGLGGKNAHKLLISQSDGGLVNYNSFTGLRGILSGPAGGAVGVAKTCYDCSDGVPILGFDSRFLLPFNQRSKAKC